MRIAVAMLVLLAAPGALRAESRAAADERAVEVISEAEREGPPTGSTLFRRGTKQLGLAVAGTAAYS